MSTTTGEAPNDAITVKAVELRRVGMPLVSPFRTSFGTQTLRDLLFVRVLTDHGEGWGEAVSMGAPLYSSEYTDGLQDVVRSFLLPRLFAAGPVSAHHVAKVTAPVVGHRMAKAAVEMAWLDAELRLQGRSWAREMGAVATRVPCGVSVGIMDSIPELLDAVGGYLDEGYVRIKLKVEHGWLTEPVAAVREAFGDIPLQVDANAAFTLADARLLRQLDSFDLLLIEQPFPEEHVRAHAELRRLIDTPVCLDESILSAQSCVDAILAGAVDIVNIKAGRVGGYLEARRIHDVCAAHDVPVWCGGMVESGLGRAANAALAAGPNFRLPGDNSASSRFYRQDIVTEPMVIDEGHLPVPTGPGLGVEIDHDALNDLTTSIELVSP